MPIFPKRTWLPPDYYGEFLKRVLQALAARPERRLASDPAGQFAVAVPDQHARSRPRPQRRRARKPRRAAASSVDQGPARILPPAAVWAPPKAIAPHPAIRPITCALLAPLVVDQTDPVGLVEIWQDPNRGPGRPARLPAVPGQHGGPGRRVCPQSPAAADGRPAAGLDAARSFARQIHNSLNPTEVSYLVANEGRRLSSATASASASHGPKKPRSRPSAAPTSWKTLQPCPAHAQAVRLRAGLGRKAGLHGHQGRFAAARRAQGPRRIPGRKHQQAAGDLPLKDERETDKQETARSALMMESFDPPAATDQMIARLEVIGKHATSALYNATEYRRIPFRFIWMPIAKLQDGLGGKAKAITLSVYGGLDGPAGGAWSLCPIRSRWRPRDRSGRSSGRYFYVRRIPRCLLPANLKAGSQVAKGQELVHLYSPMSDMLHQINLRHRGPPNADRAGPEPGFKTTHRGADNSPLSLKLDRSWTAPTKVISCSFRTLSRSLQNRPCQAGDVLAALADRRRGAHCRLHRQKGSLHPGIATHSADRQVRSGSQKEQAGRMGHPVQDSSENIGQVLWAFDRAKRDGQEDVLDVDILLASEPTRMYKGNLRATRWPPRRRRTRTTTTNRNR